MIEISSTSIEIIIGGITILGFVFTVFFYFQKPQIALEKRVSSLEDDSKFIKKDLELIKANHLEMNGAIQKEMKEMTTAINELGKTVVKLSTIIDERIPKGSPNLTPPGK